jgi:HEAT repeat protein
MESQLSLAQTLSRLIRLLRHSGSTMEEVRETLRLLVAQSRETAISFQLDEWKLAIEGTPVPPAATGYEELVGQLYAHRIRELVIRQLASAAELIKLVRLLAEAPSGDPSTLSAKIAALKLWNVEVTVSEAGDAAAPVLESPEHVVVTHHLARVRAATVPLDATHALGELTSLAEEHAAAGRAEAVAEILCGIVQAERDAADPVVRASCAKAIDGLAKPALTRLVAQVLPSLQTRPRELAQQLQALGRCGNAGAAALIAHLMAADSFDDRRVYYTAIVELRAGVPMLIDALGHPQWYVVRNAACLLGEMRESQADGALARLLEHRDERVREAAAGALARIDTATSRAALQRMIQDRSAQVRLHAASAFASSGQTKTATPLATALDAESDGDVQLGILHALGRLGTPDAVQKLVKAVMPTNGRPRPVSYRVAALEALAAARGHSAHATLRSLLSDTEPAVRDAAKRLIATTAMA